MPSSTKSRRRWKVLTAGLVLVLIAGGAAYVLLSARDRTDMYEQAVSARKSGDRTAAERLLRDLLQAKPGHARARALLIQILSDSRRFEDADALARYWLDKPGTEVECLRTLARLALHRLDGRAAVRYAKLLADRDPAFAESTLLQVHDLSGGPAGRAMAARAAEGLAAVAASPETQAAAWLFAAETLLDLAAQAGPDEREDLASRMQADRSRALSALRGSRAWGSRTPDAEAMMAAIQLLSGESDERRAASGRLEAHLRTHPRDQRARSSLIRYWLAQGNAQAALPHIRALRDGPRLPYLRALGALAAAGHREPALELLTGIDDIPEALRDRLRARILVAGDEGQREEALSIFERLAGEHPEDTPLVLESCLRIRGLDRERAVRLLEKIATVRPELRAPAHIERATVAIETGDAAAAAEAIRQIAAESKDGELLLALKRIAGLEDRGESSALQLLDAALAAGRSHVEGLRLLRAAWFLSRTGQAPTGRPWRELVQSELAALASMEEISRNALANGAILALEAGAADLAGEMVGRALVRDEAGLDPLGVYLQLLSRSSEDRKASAAGMRRAATADSPAAAMLTRLAAALEAGDPEPLRVAAGSWKPETDEPRSTGALLQFQLARMARDWQEAEAYARLLLEAAPDEIQGLARLGAVLIEEGKPEAVLDLHASARALPPILRLQRIEALGRLGRRDDAITEARVLVRETDGSDDALLVLARLLRDVDPNAAYATITPITNSPQADLLRGELLEGRGDKTGAGSIYERLASTTDVRDLQTWQRAWERLAHLRSAQEQQDVFVQRVTRWLESPPRLATPRHRATLLGLRAAAREQTGDYERALEDYMQVLELDPTNLAALNNAAWILGERIAWPSAQRPARLAQALDLSNRAVALAPGLAQALHTRGRILLKLERFDDALADVERALTIVDEELARAPRPEGQDEPSTLEERQGQYMFDKGEILESAGRMQQAIEVYERVHRERGRSKAGALAAAAAARLRQ